VRLTTASFDLYTRASRPLAREACITAGAALTVATIFLVLLPPGSDFAAHEYQLSLFANHGWTLWDNFWYGGRYTFVTYSILYYPLAALFGIKLLALLAIAVAAAARPVARLEHATVLVVPDARPIVTGPGRAKVRAMTPKTLAILVSTPGRYRISVRYSPYWHASRGCVSRTADGSVALWIPRPGRVTLALDVGLRRMLATLVHREHRCISPS
jgi:hypothetical protein